MGKSDGVLEIKNSQLRSEEPLDDAVPVPLREQRPRLSASAHTFPSLKKKEKRAGKRSRKRPVKFRTYSGSPPPPLEDGGDARQEHGRSLQGRPPRRKRPPAAGVESMLRCTDAAGGREGCCECMDTVITQLPTQVQTYTVVQ